MISKKVAEQVRELEIHTRKILRGTMIGGSKSRQRGFGFDFDQLRNYQYGDDIRLIDWKSSAKTGDKLLVRQYFEERNRTVYICFDVSASTYFGAGVVKKQAMMQQICGALALAAEHGKDKVGALFFSDGVEKVIPAAKGKQHVHSLIEALFSYEPKSKKTDLNVLFEYIAQKIDKRAIVFVVSDFIAEHGYEKNLKLASVGKEIIAISCADQQEVQFPAVGLIWMQDIETDARVLIDARKKRNSVMQNVLQQRAAQQKKIFAAYKIDFVHIFSKQHFIEDLIVFFQKRLMY